MFFNGPRLKHAFSESGGQRPQPEEQPSITDMFKAAAVSLKGPSVCQKLKATLEDLQARYTENGRAKDVQTHFALLTITKRIDTLRDTIQQGGADGYAKMKEATKYLGRIQRLGLDA